MITINGYSHGVSELLNGKYTATMSSAHSEDRSKFINAMWDVAYSMYPIIDWYGSRKDKVLPEFTTKKYVELALHEVASRLTLPQSVHPLNPLFYDLSDDDSKVDLSNISPEEYKAQADCDIASYLSCRPKTMFNPDSIGTISIPGPKHVKKYCFDGTSHAVRTAKFNKDSIARKQGILDRIVSKPDPISKPDMADDEFPF